MLFLVMRICVKFAYASIATIVVMDAYANFTHLHVHH